MNSILLYLSQTVPIIYGIYPNSDNFIDIAYFNKLFPMFASCLTPTIPIFLPFLIFKINIKMKIMKLNRKTIIIL